MIQPPKAEGAPMASIHSAGCALTWAVPTARAVRPVKGRVRVVNSKAMQPRA